MNTTKDEINPNALLGRVTADEERGARGDGAADVIIRDFTLDAGEPAPALPTPPAPVNLKARQLGFTGMLNAQLEETRADVLAQETAPRIQRAYFKVFHPVGSLSPWEHQPPAAQSLWIQVAREVMGMLSEVSPPTSTGSTMGLDVAPTFTLDAGEPAPAIATPRTEATEASNSWPPGTRGVPSDFARTLERENAILRDNLRALTGLAAGVQGLRARLEEMVGRWRRGSGGVFSCMTDLQAVIDSLPSESTTPSAGEIEAFAGRVDALHDDNGHMLHVLACGAANALHQLAGFMRSDSLAGPPQKSEREDPVPFEYPHETRERHAEEKTRIKVEDRVGFKGANLPNSRSVRDGAYRVVQRDLDLLELVNCNTGRRRVEHVEKLEHVPEAEPEPNRRSDTGGGVGHI